MEIQAGRKNPKNINNLIIYIFLIIITAAISNGSRVDDPIWKLHVISESGGGPDGARLMDVNNDGLVDVVSAYEQSGRIRIYIHPGTGKLNVPWPRLEIADVGRGEDAFLIDLNNDGNLDVFSSHEGSEQGLFVHWAPPEATNYFLAEKWITERIEIADGKRWMYSISMDVNNDGKIDVVSASRTTDNSIGDIVWLESPSLENPQWQYHVIGPVGWPMSIHKLDMDKDGDLDLIISDRKLLPDLQGLRWLENPGDDFLTLWTSHFIADIRGREGMFADVADIDGDGLLDIAVPVNFDDGYEIQVAGLFTAGVSSTLSTTFIIPDTKLKSVGIADLDGDGVLEIVVASEAGDFGIGYFKSNTGSLQDKWEWIPIFVSVGHPKYDRIEFLDVDDDGDLDIVTTEERQGLGVIWLENPFVSE